MTAPDTETTLLLVDLERMGSEIASCQGRLDTLYRDRLWAVGRLRELGLTYKRIATACGASEEALMQAVRRSRRTSNGEERTPVP